MELFVRGEFHDDGVGNVMARLRPASPSEVLAAARQLEGAHEFDVVDSPPVVDSHGNWRQQEPHIVSGKIEAARCLFPTGRYLVIPLGIEGEETNG